MQAVERAPLATILIVDDEGAIRHGIKGILHAEGYDVAEADRCQSARTVFRTARPDLVLLDYQLPDGDALKLLSELRVGDPQTVFVVLTGHGTIDLAVRSLKQGAEDFLEKPVDRARLVEVVRKALGKRRRARSRSQTIPRSPLMVGSSPVMERLNEDVERLRDAECSVLILGETGTGKSMIARRLHDIGRRREHPFVELNCASLTSEFVEAQLFGHERGAFTGAHTARIGLLEAAHEGTLFLDEMGDISPIVQPKLLKVLEERRFRRMGEASEREVDVRLLAATHRDLRTHRDFRRDLYYRISTVTLVVPPLRERREDLEPLATTLLHDLAAPMADEVPAIAERAVDALKEHSWPGNVRELRNVLERALLLRRDPRVIDVADLRFDEALDDFPERSTSESDEPTPGPGVAVAPRRRPSGATLQQVEIEHIRAALVDANGRVEAAAKELGIPRSTLYQKLKAYGISASKMRTSNPETGHD